MWPMARAMGKVRKREKWGAPGGAAETYHVTANPGRQEEVVALLKKHGVEF
jgi:hypothetical protein